MSWAIDSFTVTTINFATYYVFLVFDHGRRRVIHFAITRHPLMKWVIQQLPEAMPFGLQPKYLFRDNHGIYGSSVGAFLDSCGIEEVHTAYRSLWQNPFVERFIGTLRQEMLNHVIVLGQGHLERLPQEFIEEYYHVARPQQGIDGETPVLQTKQPHILGPSKLISIPVLGGLHHRYIRVAAKVRRDEFSDSQIACRFLSLLCRKALANPFGGIGMVSKSGVLSVFGLAHVPR
ncbi:MAG: integrase core domain-containing protein [Planctomycetota bacterium]